MGEELSEQSPWARQDLVNLGMNQGPKGEKYASSFYPDFTCASLFFFVCLFAAEHICLQHIYSNNKKKTLAVTDLANPFNQKPTIFLQSNIL